MFSKKFKIKIKPYEDLFCIKYSTYRFVPFKWETLMCWNKPTSDSNVEYWSIKLFELEDAKQILNEFTTYKDIEKYFKNEEAKRKAYLKRRADNYFKNIFSVSSNKLK